MSIMRCSRCEADIDTDSNDYDFETDLCMDCWIAYVDAACDACRLCYAEEVNYDLLWTEGRCSHFRQRFSLLRLIQALGVGIMATFKNWR